MTAGGKQVSDEQTIATETTPPKRAASRLDEARTAGLALLSEVGPLRCLALVAVLLALVSPWSALTILALLAYIALTWNDPGWTVAIIPLTLPFAYLPKGFPNPRSGGQLLFPLVELLLLIALLTSALYLFRSWQTAARSGTGAAATLDLWDGAKSLLGGTAGLVALTLLAIGTFSLFTVADRFHLRESIREYRTVLLEPLLYFVLARAWLRDRTLRNAALATFIAGGVLISLLAIGQVATGHGVVAVEGVRRALGTYQHPNALALYLVRVVTAVLSLVIFARSPRRAPWLLVSLPLLLLALLFTFSRGGFVGLGVAAAVLTVISLYHGTNHLEHSRLRWVFIAGCALVGTVVIIGSLLSLTGKINLRGGDSLELRQLIWAAALAMIRDHPAFGVGLDQFFYQYAPRYIHPAAWGERFTSHPHNLFLDFWVRLGIMGLAWLIWALGTGALLVRQTWQRATAEDQRVLLAIGLASLAGLVHGVADNYFFLIDLAFVWWFFFALVACLHDQQPATVGQATDRPEKQQRPRRRSRRSRPVQAERTSN